MTVDKYLGQLASGKSLALTSPSFVNNRFEVYRWLRENSPVHKCTIVGVPIFGVSRYDDCMTVLKSGEFVRARKNVTGRSSIPLPPSLKLLSQSMIVEDDPEHRRLRQLVQKAFAPASIRHLETQMGEICDELLDGLPTDRAFDLKRDYALKFPIAVIAKLMGVEKDGMADIRRSIRVLSEGLSGWGLVRTLVWDLRFAIKLMNRLIEQKRKNPGDDVLSNLVHAEENGDRLSQQELVSMAFLLIIAGFETTVHLISNSVVTLTEEKETLQELIDQPELMAQAVEELLRYSTPVHGTKLNLAREDTELAGVKIKKGAAVMPMLAAANRDERMFADPERFDIHRKDNKHLSFSQGNHFCLGAFLARMETRVALERLIARYPNIELAEPRDQLEIQRLPGWHRYEAVPVRLG